MGSRNLWPVSAAKKRERVVRGTLGSGRLLATVNMTDSSRGRCEAHPVPVADSGMDAGIGRPF